VVRRFQEHRETDSLAWALCPQDSKPNQKWDVRLNKGLNCDLLHGEIYVPLKLTVATQLLGLVLAVSPARRGGDSRREGKTRYMSRQLGTWSGGSYSTTLNYPETLEKRQNTTGEIRHSVHILAHWTLGSRKRNSPETPEALGPCLQHRSTEIT